MSLLEDKQMAGVAPEDQAKRALRHVLEQIRDNPKVGYEMGFGSQSFALVTEAFATLTGEPVEEVREIYLP
jgi:hypothetical protein